MEGRETKICLICEIDFEKNAKGPWCHSCVADIIGHLHMDIPTEQRLLETVTRLRQQVTEAKARGDADLSATEVPGPYWGLEL